MVSISVSEQIQLSRLEKFRLALPGGSQANYRALVRVGNHISNQTKINVTRQRLIDTGNLRSKASYEIVEREGKLALRVGVFGVKYARVHEYGFKGSVKVNSHTRVISQAFGRRIPATRVTVRAHQRSVNIKARPYLRPAVRDSKQEILRIFRQELLGGK